MEIECKYLFVYGSLLTSANKFGAYLKNNSRHVIDGCFKGLLYDMGDYPGAIYDAKIQAKVYGTIVSLNSPAVFKLLDEYEGCGPYEPHPNLFIRKIITVNTDNGPIYCWVYLYNLPVSNYPQILSGRYTQ